MNNEIIPIIFSSNDFYVPYTSVMIQSILDNSNNLRLYKIYILHKDITEESSLLLRQQVERFTNFSLEFVNVSVFFEKLNLFIPEKLTIETYFRLVIPYLLNEYDKVLFFDGDMICRVDVATLYDLDLQDNFIAAVRDIGLSQYYGKHHNYKLYKIMYELRFPERYFNGGLLLWNIKKFRDFITKQELFDLLGSRIWPICDQDMLNFLCNERVLLLSYRWNFMSQNINALPVDLQNDYQKSSENPNIIHFKPFKKWFFIPFSDYFWYYASKTDFFYTILRRMKNEGVFKLDAEEFIYRDITENNTFGLRFLLKCILRWIIRKIIKTLWMSR